MSSQSKYWSIKMSKMETFQEAFKQQHLRFQNTVILLSSLERKKPRPQTPLKGETQGKLTQQAPSAYEGIFSSCLENIHTA